MAVLRLFAAAREVAGEARSEIAGDTVADVLAAARERYGDDFGAVLDRSRVWLNGQPAEATDAVGDYDTVAILPPVSGGAVAGAPPSAGPPLDWPPPAVAGAEPASSPPLHFDPEPAAPPAMVSGGDLASAPAPASPRAELDRLSAEIDRLTADLLSLDPSTRTSPAPPPAPARADPGPPDSGPPDAEPAERPSPEPSSEPGETDAPGPRSVVAPAPPGFPPDPDASGAPEAASPGPAPVEADLEVLRPPEAAAAEAAPPPGPEPAGRGRRAEEDGEPGAGSRPGDDDGRGGEWLTAMADLPRWRRPPDAARPAAGPTFGLSDDGASWPSGAAEGGGAAVTASLGAGAGGSAGQGFDRGEGPGASEGIVSMWAERDGEPMAIEPSPQAPVLGPADVASGPATVAAPAARPGATATVRARSSGDGDGAALGVAGAVPAALGPAVAERSGPRRSGPVPLAVVPRSNRPHGRLGLAWTVVSGAAIIAGPGWAGAWFGACAGVAALQTAKAWRARGERPVVPLAAATAALLPLTASSSLRALTDLLVAALVASLVVRVFRRTAAPARDAALTLLSGVPVGLAAASIVLLRHIGADAPLLLLSYTVAYDAAAYVVGTGAKSVWEGPIAGVITLLPVTLLSATMLVPPFPTGSPLLLGLVAAALTPCGPPAGSVLLGDRDTEAPALRRLDSLLVLGPAWAWCAAAVLV